MGNLLYGRVCYIEVSTFTNPPMVEVLEGFRIQFDITKSIKPEENTAEIIITNADNWEGLFEKGAILKLYAGYEMSEGAQLLFSGEILYSYVTPEVAERHTVVCCKEGISAFREPIAISYSEGTKYEDILRGLLEKIKETRDYSWESVDWNALATGGNGKNYANLEAKSGFSHIGDPKVAITELCERLGFQWSLQNGKFTLVPKEGTTLKEAIILSHDSGLVGSVEPIEKGLGKSKGEPRVSGYRVEALLQPLILPGDPVLVYTGSKYELSAFRVEEIKHQGDTHGDKWNSTMEVSEWGKKKQ